MRALFKWIARAVIGLALLSGAVLILLYFLSGVGSKRTVYQRARSPDGAWEARVQFDDCGAACTFSRLVFVKSPFLPDDPLLSCRAFWANGEQPVRLTWVNPKTLLIRHGFAPGDVQAVAQRCGDVNIVVQSEGGAR